MVDRQRDFATELKTARDAEDWDLCSRLWEERRMAEVDYDEGMLK